MAIADDNTINPSPSQNARGRVKIGADVVVTSSVGDFGGSYGFDNLV